ncbi:similar to Pectin or pectate lyase-like protein; Polysaccharide lyase family 1 [Plenodomus lingam JN3]|uniref:Similar to Pectin or pectate lyase-like protein Polysaccharide lyase family 1 n=1 Tax=Leptosphaeria maculans (strain JN3 / isolate v23.1.3 / race Av1-4-5-6-7-8) TaxID=985895 RepID=E5A6Q1_LEPMJ|nr:similar to Pectin or pectate lyase-like protein; Polysaccharide lyase family 1 [Plenodomus lingam JN3]CBX99296.1 similar to Pectin or pectate lyase-like protein; Polysaccharide lyase family 1 [Plenodomus lingam JN3]
MGLFQLTFVLLLSVASAASSTSLSPRIDSSEVGDHSAVRVRLLPASVRNSPDEDFATWTVPNAASTIFETGNLAANLTFELAAGGGKLSGNSNKIVYTRPIASLGERVVSAGISTQSDSGDNVGGVAITLRITGLESGQHSILTWHNAWDQQNETAAVNIKIDDKEAATNVKQSTRVDNIWESGASYLKFNATSGKPVHIVYTPNTSADGRVFLNGFEIDTPSLDEQIRFPSPNHRNERVEMDEGVSSVTASWTGARPGNVSYDVYFGTSRERLENVAKGLSETSTTLSNINTQDTYYWRVDVVAEGKVYQGHVYMFRRAQLAFPGAEGYGRFARGGRGGKVVHVTSLEDNEAEGTLRYALSKATGPRTIVFDVGGVITTTSRISVNGQYITLAGQTAPGKGIVIQGHPLGLSGATDVIFQHIRVRPGTVSNQTIDGMGMQGSNHAIFDRCSLGWTIDESFSSRSAQNITLQRSMISEPLNIAGHKNYPEGKAHGFAASIGGDVGSFHHNLIAHAEGRSWSMAGGVDSNAHFAGKLDIRNNVVYNFGSRVTDGGTHQGQFVSNLYKQGPASNLTYALRAQYEDGLPGTQQYYCAGNVMPGIFDETDIQYVDDGTGQKQRIACYADVTIDRVDYRKFVDEPFFESYVTTQSATEAYKIVLSDSGASQPVQDDHDKRIVLETLNGTATYTGSRGKKPGIIDNPTDVGGLEDFPSVQRPGTWDADGDGIADWWDGSTGGEGYTPLEGYLHFMAEPHIFVKPSGSATIDLAALARGFVNPAFSVEGIKHGNLEISGSVATYTASGTGIERLTVSVEDSAGSKWSRPFGIAIYEGETARTSNV